jgi:GTPase SAR1 family protein
LILGSCLLQTHRIGTDWVSSSYWDDEVCRAIIKDIDFSLKQPPTEVPCLSRDEALKNALDHALAVQQALQRSKSALAQLEAAWDKLPGPDYETVDRLVEEEGRRTCTALNIKRLNSDITQYDREPYAPQQVTFCREYQELRRAVSAFVDSFLEALSKMDEDEDLKSIRTQIDRALAGIAIVLVGPFSSGKTTFTNTLLNLDGSEALPTSGHPETASINVIDHAETPEDEKALVEFRRSARLGFVDSADNKERWRIRHEEINAFLSWLDDGLLPSNDEIKVAHYSAKEKSALNEYDRKWLRLMREEQCAYIDPPKRKEQIPLSAEIHEFGRMYEPPSSDPQIVLDWLKDDSHALATTEVRISLCRPQLAGLIIVDTPGTDSCISYHQTMAKEFIEKNPSAAVICFFDAGHPGGNADRRNVETLNSWLNRSTNRHLEMEDRVFFVINKRDYRGQLEEGEHSAIVQAVRRVLASQGWPDADPFLIDSCTAKLDPDDHDWVQLVDKLNRFIKDKQVACLRLAMDNYCRIPIQRGLKQAMELQDKLNAEDQAQNDDVVRLNQQLEDIERLRKALQDQINKARKKLFTAKGTTFEDALADAHCGLNAIDSSFGRFVWWKTDKDEKLADIGIIVDDICEWKKMLKRNLERQLKSIHRYAEDELRELLGDNIEVESYMLPKDFVAFTTTEILEETKRDVEKNWLSYAGNLRSRIRSVDRLLNEVEKQARKSMKQEFANARKHYVGLLKREKTRIARDIRQLSSADSPEIIEHAKQRVLFYQKWLEEYDGLFGQEGEE